ncbi:MAG: hypothetical protein K0U38_08510 [Epsilonproteobacteria bacterium]|nr:hypothetical protein [Campylobacterota bacterium]
MNKKTVLSLLLCGVLLTACGSSSTNATTQTSNEKYSIAKDNIVNDVMGDFEGKRVVVYSKNHIEEKPSQTSKAIYGNIDGKTTGSLLSISDNYKDGDIFVVKVFNGDKVVGQSDELVLDGEMLEFNNIDTKGDF